MLGLLKIFFINETENDRKIGKIKFPFWRFHYWISHYKNSTILWVELLASLGFTTRKGFKDCEVVCAFTLSVVQ